MTITLAEAKAHLNITDDADDALIGDLIKVAKAYLTEYVDCPMTCSAAPAPVKQAAKMLVGTLYENRESAVVGANLDVQAGPISIMDLISPYRRWSF